MPAYKPQTKYVFVSGGVISGLGKGINTASISLLLKSAGYKVSAQKADMYLNLDAGTMNPLEHGEVFVTEDGLETDQDLGHYERFLNQDLYRHNYFTMGQVYYDVIARERSLEYAGKCVEGHIHIPQEIIKKIKSAAKKDESDIFIVEVGGTVGEYQNVMFFEAIRRMKQAEPDNVFLIHLVYLVVPPFLGEMKSKPAQNSIYDLYKLGLQPNFVICRSQNEIDTKRKKTISFNTGIREDHILSAPDVDSIYKIPLVLQDQKLDTLLLEEMKLKHKSADMKKWTAMTDKINKSKKDVRIAIAGKYFTSGAFALEDSYVCVIEAIKHAAWKKGLNPVIKWFDVERFEDPKEKALVEEELKEFDGIIVPQGWGSRAVEVKLKAVEWARTNKVPYLGLCFGMQMAVIEYARNVLGLNDANSEEVNPTTKDPVIHIMPNQKEYLEKKQYGGTIRLGAWPCKLDKNSILYKAYKSEGAERLNEQTVEERHRHRYEFNNDYLKQLEKAGLVISGTSPDGKLVESIELPIDVHPFFVGTQFHPEYKSRPLAPHPIFVGFIEACIKQQKAVELSSKTSKAS
ncbi:MAG: CTP synthetase, CTP synthase [candidate division WWE3 bacterium GW2011_GWC1_41_7]|uniref:CTP synthase n=1 Tax=candidate division WWE3 bacterium GW2011_GWC1_41_7 TaxID=1619119 RepID=A0A0G1A2V2_UNCKA|nr:MAG: CTP synthetase, CTP synthase [candidate division WWE3 bacterium GW2011_GWC1_41_7]